VDSLAKEVDQQRELLIDGEQRLEQLLLDANAVVGLRRQERRPEKPTDIRLARLRRDLEAAHEFFKKATEVGSA
jgi:hypothetical protein